MSTRRSARLKSKPITTFNGLETDTIAEEYADFVEGDLSDSDEQPAQRKRKKTTTSSRNAERGAKNVKGRKGRLRALPYVELLSVLYPPEVKALFFEPSTETCHWIFCMRSVLNKLEGDIVSERMYA
jgi:hypothetical protein